ncbi:MAG TPA: signal recognition particle receptor subunit alpha, partial [Candidatus Wallbacteria bacterium]|nr:signal recognition particle receptor subunit alpha [Candidatus Wallbacteria bacterium]
MFKKIIDYFKSDKPNDEKDAAAEQGTNVMEASEAAAEAEIAADVELVENASEAVEIENGADESAASSSAESSETALSNTSVIVEAGGKAEGFQEKTPQKSWFARLKERLGKTKNSFMRKLGELFGDRMTIDEETLERLEEILIEADIGV